MSPESAPVWSPARRIAFRFLFAYCALYTLPIVRPGLVTWTGSQVFGKAIRPPATMGGSGDTSFHWVQLFCVPALAVLAMAVWSVVDRARPHYRTLHRWLRAWLRYGLGSALIGYGMAKIIQTQFPYPSADRLAQPIGESSPMGLLWTFMGVSTLTIGGSQFQITQDPCGQGTCPACTISLNPSSAAFGPTGGSASVTVTAPSHCARTATSNAPWVTITAGASGSGNGSVSYTVQPNTTASSRAATLTIGGSQFQITQDPCGQGTCPACTISLNPSSAAFGPTGGSASVTVTAPSHCARTATSNASWLIVTSGATGAGNGTVNYAVQPNGAPSSRAATLTIGGAAFQVTQSACGAGTCGSVAPGISIPSPGQTIPVSGVGFQWTAISGAGYGLRITRGGAVVFEGTLAGSASTSTLVSLPDGTYVFSVRSCWAQPFTGANCGAFSTVSFTVAQTAPATAPSIVSPSPGQTFTASTQTFSWTSVSNATSYQVELRDQANGGKLELSLANSGAPPLTSTVYSMHSSANWALRVRACQSACGPWSATVNFAVTLPATPTAAPPAPACSLQGNRLNCSWNSVANADFYTIHAIHPTAFNGGALTVASRRTVALTTANPEAALLVPDGQLAIIVAGCNGNGCGPYSAAASVNATGGNPSVPILGNPVSGSALAANPVFFSWNRIPGDNGSNTVYRLYVQDFSRGAPALDILTTSNFHAAAFRGEGSRYDALVVANPDTPAQSVGPAAGFVVTAPSPASPTMVQPRHQAPGVTAAISAGNITLGWTPVPGPRSTSTSSRCRDSRRPPPAESRPVCSSRRRCRRLRSPTSMASCEPAPLARPAPSVPTRGGVRGRTHPAAPALRASTSSPSVCPAGKRPAIQTRPVQSANPATVVRCIRRRSGSS